VETFSNLLSEIRAYGEGILISEQIPSKLTTDALKNTSLKIMHRMVSEDDRNALKVMTNMDTAQSRYLVVMPLGQAAVFNQGDDHPLLIGVEPGKRLLDKSRPSDQRIRSLAPRKNDGQELPGMMSGDQDMAGQVELISRQLAADENFLRSWHAGHLRVWLPALGPGRMLDGVERHILRNLGGSSQLLPAVLSQVVNKLSWFDAYNRGRVYHWNYEVIRDFHLERLNCVNQLRTKSTQSVSSLEVFSRAALKKVSMQTGPYPGCQACQEPCLYRYDIIPLTRDVALKEKWKQVQRSPDGIKGIGGYLLEINNDALEEYLAWDAHKNWIELQVCLSAQLMVSLGFNGLDQKKLMDELVVAFSKEE
jgi:hypothetical protein